jgi:glycosyltransferase involved in cell wall biosynthesis
VSFSVVILTRDEEANLPRCLASLTGVDQVVVLDSGSSDRTVAIARDFGAEVVTRPFDDFAGQRNFALEHLAFRSPWVFHLDADEALTAPLVARCREAIAADRASGFFVPNQLIFEGRWLRWAGMYPSYQVRLVKLGELRFVQHGHGQREAEAVRGLGRIDEPYLHFNASKGRAEWLERHRRYARQEAAQILAERAGGLDLAGLATLDPVRRRRALKALAGRLPCRPALRFAYMYGLRLGFLDGSAGFAYCRLLARYEAVIQAELAAAGSG